MRKLEIILGDAKFIVSDKIDVNTDDAIGVNTPHFHVDKEIHIISGGSATIQIDDQAVTVTEGDICLVAPKLYHYHKKYTNDFKKDTFSFSLSKNPDHKKRKNFSEYSFYNNTFNSMNNYIVVNDMNLMHIAKEIFATPPCEKNEHIHQTLYSIFFITLSKLIEEQEQTSTHSAIKNDHDVSDGYEQKIITEEFFQTRYNQNVTIEDLAKELYRSVPQTHRIIKYHYNASFKQILIKQRMEYACMLITQGSLNLNEIAVECGYNTYNGFLSAFKKHVGKTPEEYKNSRFST